MHEKSDVHLVQEALKGNQEAFRLIVERTQDMVYRLAYRFLRDIHAAEDAVQEIYIRVWKNLHRYQTRSRLSTWMYTIAVNRCLDELKSRRQTEIPLSHEMEQIPASDAATEEEVDVRQCIAAAAERLNPKQKAVFILRDLEGLTVKETSLILQMKENNVRSNLFHARRRIHELVKNTLTDKSRDK